MDKEQSQELRPILDLLDRSICQPNGVAHAFWGLQLIQKIKGNEMIPQSLKTSCDLVKSHHAMLEYIRLSSSTKEAWRRYLLLCDITNKLLALGQEINLISSNKRSFKGLEGLNSIFSKAGFTKTP